MKKIPYIPLQMKIMLLVLGVVVVALALSSIFIKQKITADLEGRIGVHTLDIARVTALMPEIVDGLDRGDPTGRIQIVADRIRQMTGTDFVVVIDMDGIRKSHPDAREIGTRFVGGDEGPSLKGREYVSRSNGSLGYSLRSFSPVYAADGRQVGAVSVGVLLDEVYKDIRHTLYIVYFATALGLFIGLAGAVALARGVKKTLFGLEPPAIARLFEERDAMLQSIREGVVAVDRANRLTIVNAAARRILDLAGLETQLLGRAAREVIPHMNLESVMETGAPELDQEQNVYGIAILTNRVPIVVEGEIVGALATFRDLTEVKQYAEELTGVRNYIEALRAQSHEMMNKMQVILGMVRFRYYDQLKEYISHIASAQKQEGVLIGHHIKDHVLAGFILGKLSRARESGVKMTVHEQSFLPALAEVELSQALVLIIGNLLDNALDAVAGRPRREIELTIRCEGAFIEVKARDNGCGVPPRLRETIFVRGVSSKGPARGLGLALVKRTVEKLAGEIQFFTDESLGTEFVVRIPWRPKENQEES